jgi:hypothetical protein
LRDVRGCEQGKCTEGPFAAASEHPDRKRSFLAQDGHSPEHELSQAPNYRPRERKVPDVRVAEIEIDPAPSRGRREMQVSQFNGVRCFVAAS